MSKEITVSLRENAIVRHLKSKPDLAASIREIYDIVSQELKDSVSVQAYHKIIQRMVDAGKLMEAGENSEKGKLFTIAPYLSMENPRTLDDIYESLTALSPADAIAFSIDALDYYAEKQVSTLRKAAEALTKEDPVEIFFGMIEHKVRLLQQDLDLFRDKDIRDSAMEVRIAIEIEELDILAYRGLSIPLDALDITEVRNLKNPSAQIKFDASKTKEIIKKRVHGKTFISEYDVSESRGNPRRQRMSVVGSDGSIHAGVLSLTTAKDYADDYEQDYVTFNNSVAYIEQAKADKKRIEHPYHCIPMTRSALEDPSNRGMVLTPLLFPDLSESQYEHMAKCAVDVVQLRVDSSIFNGSARSIGNGDLLPQPTVHIRDGTVTPQEREFKHYKLPNSYGDMVREGIRGYCQILQKIMVSPSTPVFAGAVKSTQLKVFSRAVNWYISFGSKKTLGEPIDPTWDLTRSAHITDNAAMTFLLASLPNKNKDGKFWVTCAVSRQFHSLTEYHTPRKANDLPDTFPNDKWESYFQKAYERDMEFYNQYGGEPPYFNGVDIQNDPFVYMCNNADYITFYIGHTGGEPPPLVPRYEFIESIRNKTNDQATERIEKNIRLVVEALDETKVSLDRDHNFMTGKQLTKLVPFVTYNAHEQSKSLGKQLQTELKAIVIERLTELKKLRFPKGAPTKILPISIQRYVERYYNAIKDEMNQDPGQFLR